MYMELPISFRVGGSDVGLKVGAIVGDVGLKVGAIVGDVGLEVGVGATEGTGVLLTTLISSENP
jgi:hypothetical protein